MKTKTFLLLLFLAVICINNARAQNGVIKTYGFQETYPTYLECTGDWIFGTIWAENIYTNKNWITIIRKVDIKGYKDEACTIESGNVYELSQTCPGVTMGESWAVESYVKLSLNGKIVAIMEFNIHYKVNANGEVVTEFYKTSVHCK